MEPCRKIHKSSVYYLRKPELSHTSMVLYNQ